MDEKGNPISIKLPETIEAFRNLKNAKRFAVDIGKLAVQSEHLKLKTTAWMLWYLVYPDLKYLVNGKYCSLYYSEIQRY